MYGLLQNVARLRLPLPSSAVRKRTTHSVCLFVFACLFGTQVTAADPTIAIIVAPNSIHRPYSNEDIANIFRRRLRFRVGGEALVPLNLPLEHPIREAFSRTLYDLDPEDMEAYWNERYFHGVSPPHVVASTEAMLRFVNTTPNAIGYALDCQVDPRVETIMRLPIEKPNPQLLALCAEHATVPGIPDLQTKFAR